MAYPQDGLHLGTKRVYVVNPDSVEQNTAYKGREFEGNGIVFSEPCLVSINGTDAIQAELGTTIYIADNYYYTFYQETLLSQLLIKDPDLGVSQSETSNTDVPLTANTESATLISMTLNTGMDMAIGKGTFELSFTVRNNTNQNAKLTVRMYDDGVLGGSEVDIAIGKNEVHNYFTTFVNQSSISAASVITATAELDKEGDVLAPIDILCRVGG